MKLQPFGWVLIEKDHRIDIFLMNCDHLLGFEFHVKTFLVVSRNQSRSVYHTWWNRTLVAYAALSCNLWVCTVNRFSLHPWCVAMRPLVSAPPAQFLCPGVLVNSGRLTLTGKRGGVCKDNWLRPSTVAEAFARAGAAVVGSSLELFQYISCLTVSLLEKHLRPGSEWAERALEVWAGGRKLRFLLPKSTLQLPVSQPFVHKRVNA